MTTKNIWVAAGDGDLDRVRELVIGQQAISPNAPDSSSYTPMHAAASYGHIDVLQFLLSHGGDVNIVDNDGDTPIYTVENVETARFLVEHGATVIRKNVEDVSPIEYLADEFPEVAEYLRSTIGESTGSCAIPQHPSQHIQNAASDALTENLMSQVQQIAAHAEAEGKDVNSEDIAGVVRRSVLEGIVAGYHMTTTNADELEVQPTKRSRLDDGS